jgi:5,10-methylenetetrahydrofolate reductase
VHDINGGQRYVGMYVACQGVDYVLVLTDDHTTMGDHRSAKPVFDLDSVQLLNVATKRRNGNDMARHELTQASDVALGAVVNPNFEPLDLRLIKMEKTIASGAQFFQTQTVYDPATSEEFIRRTEGFGEPIQLGMVRIKPEEMAQFMNRNIFRRESLGTLIGSLERHFLLLCRHQDCRQSVRFLFGNRPSGTEIPPTRRFSWLTDHS